MADPVPLLTTIEEFASELVADARRKAKDDGKPPLETRVAVLKAVTSFLAVKNKLDPPEPLDKEISPVAQFQRDLATAPPASANGRARRSRIDPVARHETLSGTGPAD